MPIDWDKKVIGPLNDKFGEPVTFFPDDQSQGFTRLAVFDEGYIDVTAANGQAITSARPVVGVRLIELPLPPEQDWQVAIERTQKRYEVKEVRDDGHGHALLLMNLLGPCC